MNNPNSQSHPGAKPRAREPRTRKTKPREVRRRLVPIDAGIGFAGAAIKSLTPGVESKYHPVVCLETGAVRCECDDFRYRHAPYEPSLSTPEHWCKHVERQIRNLQRLGGLPKYLESEARPCSCCGQLNAAFGRADSPGQFICAACVEAAQALYRVSAAGLAQAKDAAEVLAVEMYHWRYRRPAALCSYCLAPESSCECAEWDAYHDDPILFQANQQNEIDRAALWAGFSWEEVYGSEWQRIKTYFESHWVSL